ncbi:MAG: FtsL-like putative cell division protein, partial [Bacteroidota bacterium]
VVGVFYIGNSHYAEKGHRKLLKLEHTVGDLRTDYTTLRAKYMYVVKQSEVLKRAKQIGLEESKKAPTKIKVKKGEH